VAQHWWVRIKIGSSSAPTTGPPALDPVLLLVCELQPPSKESLVLSALLRTLLKLIPGAICVNDDSVGD
jgi:hypothetical protein